MRVTPRDKVIFRFNPENKANYEVEDGEVFWVEVDDCYSRQITDAPVKRSDIDIPTMDCAVDSVNMKGARSGDALCVEVLVIDLTSQGIMVTSVGLGVLGDQTMEPDTKITPVHDDFAHFSEDIKLPLTLMIGVMGAAPKEREIHCAIPEDHGANMDTKLVAVGSRVYFPVGAQGAGFVVGDMHTCTGDGEPSGTGTEAADRTYLKITIYRDRSTERPVIETTDGPYFLVSRPMPEEGIRIVANDTVQFLVKKLRLNFPDAHRLLSVTCDAQICEVVDDNVTVRIHCPKSHTGIQTL